MIVFRNQQNYLCAVEFQRQVKTAERYVRCLLVMTALVLGVLAIIVVRAQGWNTMSQALSAEGIFGCALILGLFLSRRRLNLVFRERLNFVPASNSRQPGLWGRVKSIWYSASAHLSSYVSPDYTASSEPAIKELNCLGVTSQWTFDAVMRQWQANNPDRKIHIIRNFLQPGFDPVIEASKGILSNEKVIIPVVLRGWPRDHIVVMLYDNKDQRLEFYDSQGRVLKDHQSDKVVNTSESLTLLMVVDRLNQILHFREVYENQSHHQEDGYNCGIYVLDYILRRLNGETAEAISAKGLTMDEANGPRRLQLMKMIKPNPILVSLQ